MVDYGALEAAMTKAKVDVLIATDPFNVSYLTGCIDPTVWIRDQQDMAHLLVAIAFPDKSVLVGGQPNPGFPGEGVFCEMVPTKRIEMLTQELKARGFGKANIGLDLDYTPVATMCQLKALLSDACFAPVDNVLRMLRSVKDGLRNR